MPVPAPLHGASSAAALRAAGRTVPELAEAGFTKAELVAAGYLDVGRKLRAAGWSAGACRSGGLALDASDLKAAGYTSEEILAQVGPALTCSPSPVG